MNKITLLIVAVGLLFSACAATSSEQPEERSNGLTFIHLNDIYRVGAVEDGKRGGFSRVVTIVRELQAHGRNVHVLHGGDFLYPSLESNLWDGLQMVDAMNFVDAVAPMHVTSGNHEFDRRGPRQLVAAIQASEFDWLGDNYVLETGDEVARQPWFSEAAKAGPILAQAIDAGQHLRMPGQLHAHGSGLLGGELALDVREDLGLVECIGHGVVSAAAW